MLLSTVKKLKKSSSYKAFSILEVLISLSISSITIILLSKQIQQNQSISKVTKKDLKKEILERKIYTISNKLISDVDKHNLFIAPTIHKNSEIIFKNKKKLWLNFSPSRNSDAITYFELSLKNLLKIKSIKKINEYTQIKACLSLHDSVPINYLRRSLLLLGINSKIEVRVLEIFKIPGTPCYEMTTQILNESFITYSDNIFVSKLIIPIRSVYSYLVDDNYTLRRLSHIGQIITENQPISEEISFLKINYNLIQQDNLLTLNTSFSIFQEKEKFFFTTNTLRRESEHNLILTINE